MKPYIEMSTKLRTEAKKRFWERFFQIDEQLEKANAKTMESVRKRRDTKLVLTLSKNESNSLFRYINTTS